jgi:2-polyprenyl-3-methyl-5-hydroxy-6-metoxy-1,4-benzoquinol methylase
MAKLRWQIAQFAEIRWWQQYLKGKDPVGYLQWKTSYWQDFMDKVGVHPQPGETVLDAGCGPAGVFITIKNNDVDAVDPLVDHYEEKLPHFKKSAYPNVTFFSLPFEKFDVTENYDVVFCLNAINHVENLEKCFDKLANYTKKGGKLVISIDAHNHQLFKRIFRLIQVDTLHPHQYDLKEYKNMLESRGFEVTHVELFQKRFLFDYYALVCTRV